jgi:hypothetical protein
MLSLLPQCANTYIITPFETQTIKVTATPVYSPTQHCIFIQCQREPTPFIHYFLLWFIILQRLKFDWKWLPAKTAHIYIVIFQMLEYANCNYVSKKPEGYQRVRDVLQTIATASYSWDSMWKSCFKGKRKSVLAVKCCEMLVCRSSF